MFKLLSWKQACKAWNKLTKLETSLQSLKYAQKALNKLKTNWKTLEDYKFEYLVRKITINELMTIEERKHVRREAAEIKEKLRLKKEAEEDAKADQTF